MEWFWIHQNSFSIQKTSHIWNGFGWCVGDGASFKIGLDPILVLKSHFLLSDDLCAYRYDYGISNISQAHNNGEQTMSSSYWLLAEDLELGGAWKEEWINYTMGLYHGGSILHTLKDRILWLHNKNDGEATTQLAHDLIANNVYQVGSSSSSSYGISHSKLNASVDSVLEIISVLGIIF